MNVEPFHALRPRADLASVIPSVPYDVVDSEEARALAEGNPHSFLHVVKPEIDLDPSIDPHDERVYAKGAANLRGFRDRGWLVRDDAPAYYVYRLEREGASQTGVVGLADLDDYLQSRIKRHEKTRADKERDRTRHAEVLRAQPGPLFLAYRESETLAAEIASATKRPPEADFVASDGVRHALWKVDAPDAVERIRRAFAELTATYIADGHHRAASYASVARKGVGPPRLLAVHFPAAELKILDYNRLVRDLAGCTVPEFVDAVLDAGFRLVEPWRTRRPERPGSFGCYTGGRWRLFVAPDDWLRVDDPVARLDVAVLASRILDPILKIGDVRTDPRIDFLGGGRGLDELERRVDSGAFAAAFAMYPTSMDDVMAVSDAGLVMPPKSTWFEPKLRSGLVVHAFDA